MKAHVADWQTLTHCLRIEPLHGPVVRLTDYPVDLKMSNGEVYQTFAGYQISDYQVTTDMSGSAIDLEGILGIVGIEREQIAAGVYDNARCYLFATSWAAPVEDEEPITKSILGKAKLVDDKFTIEQMSLIDALNQSVGESFNVRCGKTLGQLTGRPLKVCGVDLGPLTVTGSLTAVTSRLICRDASRGEVADWFAYGLITWTSGDNAGLAPMQVKRHEADGTLELFEAVPYPMQVGDGYSMTPGCRKRLEDCRDKFNNIINGGMFSFIPTEAEAGTWGTK